MFKVNNKDIVFVINSEHILHLVLTFLLLTLNMKLPAGICNNPSPSEDLMVKKKKHLTKYLEISKREIRMFILYI